MMATQIAPPRQILRRQRLFNQMLRRPLGFSLAQRLLLVQWQVLCQITLNFWPLNYLRLQRTQHALMVLRMRFRVRILAQELLIVAVLGTLPFLHPTLRLNFTVEHTFSAVGSLICRCVWNVDFGSVLEIQRWNDFPLSLLRHMVPARHIHPTVTLIFLANIQLLFGV